MIKMKRRPFDDLAERIYRIFAAVLGYLAGVFSPWPRANTTSHIMANHQLIRLSTPSPSHQDIDRQINNQLTAQDTVLLLLPLKTRHSFVLPSFIPSFAHTLQTHTSPLSSSSSSKRLTLLRRYSTAGFHSLTRSFLASSLSLRLSGVAPFTSLSRSTPTLGLNSTLLALRQLRLRYLRTFCIRIRPPT